MMHGQGHEKITFTEFGWNPWFLVTTVCYKDYVPICKTWHFKYQSIDLLVKSITLTEVITIICIQRILNVHSIALTMLPICSEVINGDDIVHFRNKYNISYLKSNYNISHLVNFNDE